MDYLGESYPRLYIFILEQLKRPDLIDKYMELCKSFQNNAEKFSLYVHGYFLILLDLKRQAGQLTEGK